MNRIALAAALSIVLGMTGCTSPPEASGSAPAGASVAAPVNACPPPGTRIERASWPDRRSLYPLVYVATPPGRLCLVSPDGRRQYTSLLGMRFYLANDPALERLERAVASLFPLRVGNHAFASVTGTAVTEGETFLWTFEFRVTGTEMINATEAFIVTLVERGQPPNMYGVDSTAWIDPRSNAPLRVRHAMHRSDPPFPYESWDAVSVYLH